MLYQNALLVLTVLFVALLVGETVADQQQWRLHQTTGQRAPGAAGAPGFLREGLFRYSRHPNYFFEIAQWWVVFGFGALAARSLWQSTVLGAVLLTVLFIGSTRFTEKISSAKYPEYHDDQRQVSAIVPWRPCQGADVASDMSSHGPTR